MSAGKTIFGQKYAYGYGRVGVLQEFLLSQTDVERLLATSNEQELAKALTELRMSTRVEFSSDPHHFINNLERWIQQEVESMVPENERKIFGILWLKNDASLLAYLLKRSKGFTSAISSEPQIGASAYDPDLLQDIVEKRGAANPPEELAELVRSTEVSAKSPQEIDTRVAQFVVDRQLHLAGMSGSRALRRYVSHHIDLLNIRTARRLGDDDKPEDHLLTGGDIDVHHFSLDKVQLAEVVRKSELPDSLAESIMEAADSSVELERGLARAIAHDIGAMRDEVLAFEPLFAFAAIAQSQLKLLRTIIIGKATRLPNEEIRKLLPPFLSASPFA